MSRDFILSTVLSSIWICICFLFFGGLYASIPRAVGHSKFFKFENSLGTIEVIGGAEIAWISVITFGVVMLIASAPINYYWSRRIKEG